MVTDADIPFIEKAIERAKLCQSEGGDPRPKVGAVLADKGECIEAAHRGHPTIGGHAEEILLEDILKDALVSGATLYTTLEPCVMRGPGKVPCADIIKSRGISRVVIGMLDPDQNICGRGVRALRQAGVEVELFPVDYAQKVEDQNRAFSRHREEQFRVARQTPVIGLTLETVEFEPAPTWHWKFKFRMYWVNDGEQVHIGRPTWSPGGIGLQSGDSWWKYQLWDPTGEETPEVDVPPDRKVRLYIGLDPSAISLGMVQPHTLLDQGRLGTLTLPLTLQGKRAVELRIRPRSSILRPRV